MSTTYSDIRDAIATLVSGVTDIGKVHNRVRWAADWKDFNAFFTSTIGSDRQIRGWWVTWGGIPETGGDFEGFGPTADTYRFYVRGVLGFQDSADTETTFLSLFSDVVDAVRDTIDFGVAAVVKESVSVRTNEPDIRQFGSVLCHFGEIVIDCVVVR